MNASALWWIVYLILVVWLYAFGLTLLARWVF